LKLLLDTTYLMPFINVDVKGVSRGKIERALRKNRVQISEIQLFELYAKGNKLEARKLTTLEDVIGGVESISHFLEVLPLVDPDVLRNANTLYRLILDDLIDSIILATALKFSEALATLDPMIAEAYERPEVRSLNPHLRITKL
jgi:PIN domain nuclease of toxin-antitoxin system